MHFSKIRTTHAYANSIFLPCESHSLSKSMSQSFQTILRQKLIPQAYETSTSCCLYAKQNAITWGMEKLNTLNRHTNKTNKVIHQFIHWHISYTTSASVRIMRSIIENLAYLAIHHITNQICFWNHECHPQSCNLFLACISQINSHLPRTQQILLC